MLSFPLVVLGILGTMLGVLFLVKYGAVRTLFALFILTACSFPLRIVHIGEPSVYFLGGISDGSPVVKTYAIPVLAGAFVWFMQTKFSFSRAWLLIVGFVLPMSVWVWNMDAAAYAGVLHIVIGVTATFFGMLISDYWKESPEFGGFIVRILLIWTILESAVCVLQLLGFDIFPMDQVSATFEGARANGTFGHPGTLGKMCVLLLFFLLGVQGNADRRTRKVAWLTIAIMAVSLLATASRTNFAAFLLALLVFVLVSNLEVIRSQRWWVISSGILLAAGSSSIWAWRFRTGEDGSYRRMLADTALEMIRLHPLSGAGPNRYLLEASWFDPLAAQGWPVHNIWLLAAAEIGIPGTLLISGIFFYSFIRSFLLRNAEGASGAVFVSYVSVFSGCLLIGMTGWTLVGDSLVVLFALLGFICRQFSFQILSRNAASRDFDAGVTRKFRTVGLCSGSPGEGWRVVGFELGRGLVADG